jgi:hypothetical protein
MTRIVYLDEAGDHSLERDDPTFPVFALVMFVCEIDAYNNTLVPMVNRLKMDYFGHESVIIHSRDIRKAQGAFGFLTDPAERQPFYDRINNIMACQGYTLIASVIRKQQHKERYGMNAANPYDLSLTFALERLLPLLESEGQDQVYLVAEARGKREDNELRLTFLNTVTYGTEFIPAERFRQVNFHLVFQEKKVNVVGTQLADLAAYPIARHVIDPARNLPAYDVIKNRFYRGAGAIRGLKIFP